MFRSLFGFAVLAVVAWFGLTLLLGLFGIILGLAGKILWLAFMGFLVYMVLRIVSPKTADKVRDTINGRSAA
jgi:hypothetical protein